MPRLRQAFAVSLALHFLLVVSFAMVRSAREEDRSPDITFVQLVAPVAPPAAGEPPPGAPPSPLAAAAPAPPAALPEPAPAASAPAPAEAPPAEVPPAPAPAASPDAMAAPVDPPRPSPAPEARAIPPVEAPPPAEAPHQSPPPAPPAPAAQVAAAPPGAPGEHEGQGYLCPKCLLAKEGPPIADHILDQTFPREILPAVPWGRGRVMVKWLPGGNVVWDAESSNARFSEGLAQVRWQHFPHPVSFGLPNQAVLLDIEISGGRIRVRGVVPV